MITKWLAGASLLALVGVGCGDDAAPSAASDTTVDSAAETTPEVTADSDVLIEVEVTTPVALPPIGKRLDFVPGGTGGTGVRVQPALAWSRAEPARLAVAWTGQAGDGLGIVLGVWDVDASGYHPKRQPAVLNTDTMGMRNEPAVCGLADGGFVVAWSVDLQNETSDNLRVAFRRVDSDGDEREQADHVVTTERAGNHWLVDVACRPTAGFVLTGVRPSLTAGVGFEVFVQRFGGNGAPDEPPFAALVRTSGSQASPVVGVDARDDLWVAWEDTATATARTVIAARRFFRQDDPLPMIELVSGQSDAQAALVAVDAQGHALVGGVLGTKLQLRTVVAGSQPEVVALPDTTGVLTVAADAPLADDRFAVVYYRGSGASVDARFGVVDDGVFGAATTLASGSFPAAYHPALAAQGGNVAVAWTESIGGGAYAINVTAFGTE